MESVPVLECPQLTVLQQFLNEELPEDSAQLVESHVVCCTSCQIILESLVGRVSVDALLKEQAGFLFGSDRKQGSASRTPEDDPGAHSSTGQGGSEFTTRYENGDTCPDAIGPYRVIGRLGQGANGIVYHAHDAGLDRPVAIKVPHEKTVTAAGGIGSYLKEARTLALLDHPHIVRVYEVRPWGETSCYIASQFIAGGNLAERLASGRFEPYEAARLLLPLADALQHAHERGICHRDVKPANILLDANEIPWLADFGLALQDEELGSGPRFLGTPAYMSPEQARGEGHRVDGRTDIYSLGVVFFRMLAGRRPFVPRSTRELFDLIINADAPSARQKNRLVPPELDRICAKAMARKLADRYRSAAELADDLRSWLESNSPDTRSGLRTSTGDVQRPSKATWPDGHSGGRMIGDFELRSRLGSGGMGIVYRAWQRSPDREVALKCLRIEDPTARTRFLTEMRALGQVEHSSLVRVYASGEQADQLYYAMELIEGTGFRELLGQLSVSAANTLDEQGWREAMLRASDATRVQQAPIDAPCSLSFESAQSADLTDSTEMLARTEHRTNDEFDESARPVRTAAIYVRKIVETMRSIALATDALHEKGIIHRDIKPENILLARDGQRAVLMDLGIAKLIRDEAGGVTRTREFVGSLRYASPEQVLDSGEVDHRTDVYSLGATLWELLALQPLFGIDQGVPDPRAMLKIEIEEPPPVRKYNRAVSSDLQAVVQKCLEKDPRRRYQSAVEFVEELERVLEGRPVLARPVGPTARAFRRCRRRPLVSAMTVMIALLGSALFASLMPAQPSNVMRIGIKPWVGFTPLVVAAELNLCEGSDIQFVPVHNTTETRQLLLARELDFAPYLVDSHVLARSTYTPTKTFLQLDVSLTADAVVAAEGIESFEDLTGKRVAYMVHEAPHFLLLALCERYGLDLSEFEHVKSETAKEAVDRFLAGDADAVVSYEPFLQAALQQPGAHRLDSAADEPGSIIDILTVHEDYLETNRPRVEALIAAWFKGLELLEQGDKRALEVACRFLGSKDRPLRIEEYREMAAGMRYGGYEENREFFSCDTAGRSEFHERFEAAQNRWDRNHHLAQRTDATDGDGSAVFLELYGE